MAQLAGTIRNSSGKHISQRGINRIKGMITTSSSLFGLSLIAFDDDLQFADFVNSDYDAAKMSQLIKQRRKGVVNTLGHGVEFQTIAEKYGAEYETPLQGALAGLANLTADAVDDVSATINWDDFATATGYEYKLMLTGSYEEIGEGTTVTSTLPLTGLTQLTSYTVKVRATNATGVISKWTTVSFTTLETV